MFKSGELIYYGKTGVCEVVDVVARPNKSAGGSDLYYQLKPFYQTCLISVPVDNDKIYIRKIITEDEVYSLIGAIPDMDDTAFYCSNLNQLKDHYRQIIDSRDNYELMRLILSVRRKRTEVIANKKKLGAVDEKFLRDAEGLLYGEFAAVLGIDRDDVEGYISKYLEESKA